MSDGATRHEPIAWRQPSARCFSLGTCKTRLRRVLSLPATLNQQRMARNVFVSDVYRVLDGKKDHDYVSRSQISNARTRHSLVAKSEKSDDMRCAPKEACLLLCCHAKWISRFFFGTSLTQTQCVPILIGISLAKEESSNRNIGSLELHVSNDKLSCNLSLEAF